MAVEQSLESVRGELAALEARLVRAHAHVAALLEAKALLEQLEKECNRHRDALERIELEARRALKGGAA